MSSKRQERLRGILDEISAIEELHNIPGFMEDRDRLRDRLSDDEFRIAVVGEFSSGKSTFINAWVGHDILKHATTETTAVITRIVNVTMDDPRRMTGRVVMKDDSERSMPDLNELKEFTTTQSDLYPNGVSEVIDFVEIYLPFMVSRRPVVLVDTPGLNGMAEGHREQTVDLIQRAHSCIYLIPRGGLGESDISFLAYLAKIQKNFIFIQNFIDELRESEGDSVPQKLEEQRGILKQKVFAENPECVYCICGLSALMELASVDTHIERLYADSPGVLTPEGRRRLHEESGFNHFRQVMSEVFREDRMDEIQYGGTSRAIANWIQALLDHISLQEKQAREYYNASHDKGVLDKLERLRERILSGEQRQRENLRNFIIAQGGEIYKEECDRLKEKLEDLDGQTKAQMEAIQDVSGLDRYEKNLSGLLESGVGRILTDENAILREKFQTLYQILLTRIDEYSGMKNNEDLNLNPLTIKPVPEVQPSFSIPAGRIEEWEEKKKKKEQELAGLEDEGGRLHADQKEAKRSEDSIQRDMRDNESRKGQAFAGMGRRPEAREYRESYITYEPHGGLGILDFFFGDKKVTKYRTVRDDSAGEEWDQKRKRIQNEYVIRYNEQCKELAAARRRKEDLILKEEENQKKLESVQKQIDQLKKNIVIEREKLEKERRLAAREYMNLRCSSLQKQIHAYLLGEDSALERIEMNLESSAKETEESFIAFAMDRFSQALRQKLQWIDQCRQEKTPEILKQAENYEEICGKLKKILKEAEES